MIEDNDYTIMNEGVEFLRISKNGPRHILSDRTPFKWKELIDWTTSSIFLIWFLGIIIGFSVSILTLIGCIGYRFALCFYYTALEIDEKSGAMTRFKKMLQRTHRKYIITDTFDPSLIEFTEINRSSKN